MSTLKLDFRALLIGGGIAVAIGSSAAYFLDLSFYLAVVGALVAMFVNSFIAELQDHLPEGFNSARAEGGKILLGPNDDCCPIVLCFDWCFSL